METYDGKYIPDGDESGTDFRYRDLADKDCKCCGGYGEWHVPYEDYDAYIIHRCECTRGGG